MRLGGYSSFETPDDLRQLVVGPWSYWRPQGAPPIPGRGHRLAPDGDFSLAFVTRRGARGALADAEAVVIGPIARASFFAPDEGYRIDAVRLHPEYCRDLFRTDPDELFDVHKPLGGVLLDRLVKAPEPIDVLLAEVRKRAAALSRESALANAALARLRAASQATLRLDVLGRQLGVSERHLRRIVRERAGFSPKHIQRMARVARAIAAADSADQPDWARIAGDCGFYDQPHMIQELQAVAGCAPAQLLRERRLEAVAELSNPSAPSI